MDKNGEVPLEIDVLEPFFASRRHAIVLGGPGSGKTTAALLKAGREIESGALNASQRIVFLSFARATVARVAERAASLLSSSTKSNIEINTYHGFAWRLLRSHGYLLNARSIVTLLPPPEAAAKLSGIPAADREAEKLRLFNQEGHLHFDLFASLAAELLTRSKALKTIISSAYPIVILDEFQDTNPDEWKLIGILGERSRLVALADAEQRIYEFRGADPRRIGDFIEAFGPDAFDLSTKNHRSDGTDIVTFGNDLLTKANRTKRYSNVSVVQYRMGTGIGVHRVVKSHVLGGIARLHAGESQPWSLAILVPSKRLMIEVSDYLGNSQLFESNRRFPEVAHEVALDTEGPALSAVLIGRLLECGSTPRETVMELVFSLTEYLRGRKGSGAPTKLELALCNALDAFADGVPVRGKNRVRLIGDASEIANKVHSLVLTGDPGEDWLAIRRILFEAASPEFQQVSEDAKYLRLLNRGAQLRSRLGEIWRRNGNYSGASIAVKDALLQEHFSASSRNWTGVHVMTIHKSKGKEFDEVIIYEGVFQGRVVRAKATDRDVEQSRLALRVAVTRAMQRVTILTPERDPCPLL